MWIHFVLLLEASLTFTITSFIYHIWEIIRMFFFLASNTKAVWIFSFRPPAFFDSLASGWRWNAFNDISICPIYTKSNMSWSELVGTWNILVLSEFWSLFRLLFERIWRIFFRNFPRMKSEVKPPSAGWFLRFQICGSDPWCIWYLEKKVPKLS